MRKCEMIRAVIPISPFLPVSLFSSLFSFLFACVNNIGALFLSFTLANPMTGVGVALEDARPCCSTAAVNRNLIFPLRHRHRPSNQHFFPSQSQSQSHSRKQLKTKNSCVPSPVGNEKLPRFR
ncbi:hypothetical protein FRC19_006377 [Serendipita sp. 401]|nr:hypothetical protein FRC19_006377 [Serendipita sp. 401]KAG9023375.1 hypothetical protein FS842_005746 [Serendipita sp. 407]